jgi:hypothetical protein
MRTVITISIAIVLICGPGLHASQQPVTAATEAAAFKEMAAAIPLGSRVKLQTKAGRRLTATLMSVTDDAVVVKRESRVPEPAVTVPFSEVARLQREEKSGLSIGKAIGIGLAAGAGAILVLFGIALTIDD